jgi:hypothetical protein
MAKAKSAKRTSSPRKRIRRRPEIRTSRRRSGTSTTFSPAGSGVQVRQARLPAPARRPRAVQGPPGFLLGREPRRPRCRFIECLPHIEGPKPRSRARTEPRTRSSLSRGSASWSPPFSGGDGETRGRGSAAATSRSLAATARARCPRASPSTASRPTARPARRCTRPRRLASRPRSFSTPRRRCSSRRSDFAGTIGAVVNKHEILKPTNNGRFMPLSREAKSLDGKNLHFGIIDELHAHKTREVYDVLETAMAKRIASLLWIITTAGSDTSGICYEVRGYTIKVLERTSRTTATSASSSRSTKATTGPPNRPGSRRTRTGASRSCRTFVRDTPARRCRCLRRRPTSRRSTSTSGSTPTRRGWTCAPGTGARIPA